MNAAGLIRAHNGQPSSDVREIYLVQVVNRNGSSCDRRAMNAKRWPIPNDTAVVIQWDGRERQGLTSA